MSATIAAIDIAAEPEAWRAVGFDVDDEGVCRVGSVPITLSGGGEGRSFAGWTLSGAETSELDGLATTLARGDIEAGTAVPEHPNGVAKVDPVVAFSPDLDRTIAALEAAGLDLRRIREEPTPAGAPRQAFFRLGEVILEVVQQHPEAEGFDPDRPARLWGLAFVASDLDALAERLGDLASGPRDAVQEGRRIVTVRRGADAGVPIAFMSPV